MIPTTADFGVAGVLHHLWSFHAAGVPAAMSAQRKRANAAPTIASVDRSFI